MKDGSNWVFVTEGDEISAFRKSGGIAVVPDIYLDYSKVVIGSVCFRFKGDVKTVLREVLDVDVTMGIPPKQTVSQVAPIDGRIPRIDIMTGKPRQQ